MKFSLQVDWSGLVHVHDCTQRVLSIQQKFCFKFQKFHVPSGSPTFCLHRPNPSHWAFGYCPCQQNTEEQYWGQQFVKLKGTFWSDLPNNQTSQSGPPSKLVSNILVRMKLNGLLWRFISILTKICRNLWKLNCNKVESDKSHIMALHVHFSVSDITHLKMQWNMYNIFGLFQGSFSPQLPSR